MNRIIPDAAPRGGASLPNAGRCPVTPDLAVDVDLDALFTTPQITTDGQGVHRDAQGRRYDLLEVDGEATFVSRCDHLGRCVECGARAGACCEHCPGNPDHVDAWGPR